MKQNLPVSKNRIVILLHSLTLHQETLSSGQMCQSLALEPPFFRTKGICHLLHNYLTEQNYSKTEKELYAILFGCKHYHQYLQAYGKKFTIVSDHKHLQVVLNCSISKLSPSLQWMLLENQLQNFKVVFRPGKEIPIAHALLLFYLNEQGKETQIDIESYVHSVMALFPVGTERLNKVKEETARTN